MHPSLGNGYLVRMNKLLLQKLNDQHKEIAYLLEDLPASFVSKRQRPDKWSMLENLAHLGRYQEVFLQRLLRILSHDKPKLGRYKAEEDPLFATWHNLGVDEISLKLKENRQDLIQFFENLSSPDWERTGIHPVLGPLSVKTWLQFFLLHESHHLYTIFKIRHSHQDR